MEDFDALSNEEIRDRLKKFGLPIIPVTTTTRKLMIKRLTEAAGGGGAKASNNKARRETINVVKPLPADDSESDADVKRPAAKPKPTAANRRTTIAAPTVVPVVAIEKPKPKPIVPVTIEKAPTIVPAGRKTPLSKPIVADVTEQSDDDLTAPVANTKPRRTSRSPSLGKSTVVTTSYKHTIEPLIEKSIDNDDVILVNDEDSDPGIDEFNANKSKISHKNFATSTLRSISNADTNNASRRTTIDAYRSTITQGPTLLSEYRDQAKEVIAANDSLFRRRYTTNTPAKDPIARRDLNGDGGAENEDPLAKVDTPFLSDFTRRLAQLRAEPLANLNNTFEYDDKSSAAVAAATSPSSLYRQDREYYRPSYAGRPSLGRSQYARSARADVQLEPTAWKKLEKKVRWPLFGFLGLFLCVLIYVFLFTN